MIVNAVARCAGQPLYQVLQKLCLLLSFTAILVAQSVPRVEVDYSIISTVEEGEGWLISSLYSRSSQLTHSCEGPIVNHFHIADVLSCTGPTWHGFIWGGASWPQLPPNSTVFWDTQGRQQCSGHTGRTVWCWHLTTTQREVQLSNI